MRICNAQHRAGKKGHCGAYGVIYPLAAKLTMARFRVGGRVETPPIRPGRSVRVKEWRPGLRICERWATCTYNQRL